MPFDPTQTILSIPGEGQLVYESRTPGHIIVRDAQGVARVLIAEDLIPDVVNFCLNFVRYHGGREGA